MFDSIVIEKYFCKCLNTFVSFNNTLSHKDNCFGCFLKEIGLIEIISNSDGLTYILELYKDFNLMMATS